MTDALETGKIRVRHMTHCLCEEEPCTPCGFDNPHRTRPVAEGGQTRLASGFRIRMKSYFFFEFNLDPSQLADLHRTIEAYPYGE
jgi:hypothetical protein